MSNGNRQRWDAMSVREYQDGQGQQRSFWTKIGSAFTNKDGSIGIQLDAFPIDGRIILQIPLSKEEREQRFGNRQRGGGGGGGQQQRGGGFGGGGRQSNAQRYNRGGGQPQQPFQGQQQAPEYEPGPEDEAPPFPTDDGPPY
jgi:hypothetical protein